MSYADIGDLPTSVRIHLPIHAQEIYRAAFNNAWTVYASQPDDRREEIAHRVAWVAVKHKYCKDGERWVEQ